MFLFAVAVVLQSQTARMVTAEFRPTRMNEALKILSAASGQTLKAPAGYTDEILFARLHDAPLKPLLRHIEEIFCAKWQRKPDGSLWLTDDPQARQRLQDKERAEDRRHIVNSLAYLTKRLSQMPAEYTPDDVIRIRARVAAVEAARKAADAARDYDREFTDSDADEENPTWRAGARLALLLSPDYYQDLAHTERQVWAERPTHMQREFPDAARDILATYRKELALFKPDVQVDRVEFLVTKWETTCGVNVGVVGYDHQGKLVDQFGVRMNDDSDALKIPFNQRNNFPAKPGEKPLEPTEEMRHMNALASYVAKDPHRDEWLERWQTRILDPDRFEPLEYYQGAYLVLAAKQLDRNLIGTCNDLPEAFDKPLTASQLLAKERENFLPADDGWLVFRSVEHLDRVPRQRAGNWIRQSVAAGMVSLDSAADWAAESSDNWPFINWLGTSFQWLLPGEGAIYNDGNSLRLWSALGNGIRARLRRGETVEISDLPGAALQRLQRFVYWDNLPARGAEHETTDLLPNGIDGGRMRLAREKKPIFFAWKSGVGFDRQPDVLDPSHFGKYLAVGNDYMEERPEKYRAFDRFRVGVKRTYTLKGELGREAVPFSIDYDEVYFDPSASPTDRLPDAIAQQVDASRRAEMARPHKAENTEGAPPPR